MKRSKDSPLIASFVDQSIYLQLRSVHDLKDNVSDATDDLSVSRRKLQDLKDEIRKIKTELNDRKSKLENATFELGRAVGDLQTSQLYNLNNEESGILGYDLNLAECEIEQARRRIREAENDLNSVVSSNSFITRGIFIIWVTLTQYWFSPSVENNVFAA